MCLLLDFASLAAIGLLTSAGQSDVTPTHGGDTAMVILNLLAILCSPVIAVLVSMWIQGRKERRQHQLLILSALIATRHEPLANDSVRALNTIDLIFHNKRRVRELWHEYFGMLCNDGFNNPTGWAERAKKNIELIAEMARVLGYGKVISHLDVDRVYRPAGVAEHAKRTEELLNELLRVLKATAQIKTTPMKSGSEQKP